MDRVAASIPRRGCRRSILLAIVAAFLCVSLSVGPSMGTPIGRELQAAREEIEPGITRQEVNIKTGANSSRIWIFLPGNAFGDKLPCVLIAPAGSRLWHGGTLGRGSMPEHLPYVRAGFAVVAYDLDGELPEHPTVAQIRAAARAFRNAQAGVANARRALDYVLARVSRIDPDRIYAVGHSSAGTLALLVAEREPRIKACVAYAPVADVIARVGERMVTALSTDIPGYREFLEWSSPDRGISSLKCPVFLFTAADDSNVRTDQVISFAYTLQQTNPRVTLVRVHSGGHYLSMLAEGIPNGIEWLKNLPR
jgi:dipeptidyl aminopeptidase/acylaminoacyl peptidase